jgi:hypothetical protein
LGFQVGDLARTAGTSAFKQLLNEASAGAVAEAPRPSGLAWETQGGPTSFCSTGSGTPRNQPWSPQKRPIEDIQ